jgi:Mg-chelatase subunit ChlD
VAAVRPLRPGDRGRDFSVRHTVRAAVGAGGFGPRTLRALARQPTARYDVAVVLDVSASMGQDRRPLVAPACAALARVLLRDGHRVGSVAFCEEAVTARRLSTHPGRLFPAGGYNWAHATNVEEGLEAGRRLLSQQSAAGHRRHLILVTDAEATSFNDLPSPFAALAPGPLVKAAQAAALRAAVRCAHQGITVSVLYPDDTSAVLFARRLARAGGGRCLALRAGPSADVG